MTIRAGLGARDPRVAARSAVLILGACALLLALFGIFGPATVTAPARVATWPSVVGLAVVAALFALVPAERLDRYGGFLLLAVTGVVLLCVLVWVTGTDPTGAQALLAFAVLYAGFHLRALAVVVVTVAAVVSDAPLLLVLEPSDTAATDLVFFGAMFVVMAVLFVRSGNAQERMVAALRQQAGRDALTGLVTRRVLDQAVTTALSAAEQEQGTALVLVDVDGFKAINDAHGHPVGDDALVHLAALINRSVRAGDAVVGRLGGDELAVLLQACPPEVAERRAEQLLEAVRAAPLVLPDGTLLALSVSIGVAHSPRHATGVRELYAAADSALYAAKRGGRGRVVVAAPRQSTPR